MSVIFTAWDTPEGSFYTNASMYERGIKVENAFVAKKNSGLGLIGYDRVYTEFIYDAIFLNPERMLDMRIYGEDPYFYEGHALDNDFNICPATEGFGGEIGENFYNQYDKKLYYSGIEGMSEINGANTRTVVKCVYYEGDFTQIDWTYLYDYNTGEMNKEVFTGWGYYCNGKMISSGYDSGASDDEGAVLYKNNKIYVFDKNGKCYSNGVYDKADNGNQELYFLNGYLTVCKNGKWGLIDTSGKEVLSCQFEDISSVCGGKAWAKQNGKWGIIKLL